jgi:hypothetical protein
MQQVLNLSAECGSGAARNPMRVWARNPMTVRAATTRATGSGAFKPVRYSEAAKIRCQSVKQVNNDEEK